MYKNLHSSLPFYSANEAWVVSDGKVTQVESFEAYRNKQLKLLKKA